MKMLFFCLYLVSLCFFVIKTEGNIVRIEISDKNYTICSVPRNVSLVVDTRFSVQVRSSYLIDSTICLHDRNHDGRYTRSDGTIKECLKKSPDSRPSIEKKFNISYERVRRTISNENSSTVHNTSIYTYTYTTKVKKFFEGKWKFHFTLVMDYDPVSCRNTKIFYLSSTCGTTIAVVSRSAQLSGTIGPEETISKNFEYWAKIVIPIILVLLLSQTACIIIYIIKGRASKKKLNDQEPKTNIADRPPLPLPPEVACKEVAPAPAEQNTYSVPVIPMGPYITQQAYRNQGLDISDELIKSPGFARKQTEGPFPNQPLRNQAINISDELVKTPAFSRKHIKAPSQQQLYRNNISEDSGDEHPSSTLARKHIQATLGAMLPTKAPCGVEPFKSPRPAPRSLTPPLPEKIPAHNFACRQGPPPLPPLHPKKLPIYPHPARVQDNRMSDDEWQYEALQPACQYLNR